MFFLRLRKQSSRNERESDDKCWPAMEGKSGQASNRVGGSTLQRPEVLGWTGTAAREVALDRPGLRYWPAW